MRKITREACEALRAGKYYKNSNTEVMGGAMYLFGNEIARRTLSGDIEITTAGWNTATTAERLCGLGARVSVRKGQAYLNGERWTGAPTILEI